MIKSSLTKKKETKKEPGTLTLQFIITSNDLLLSVIKSLDTRNMVCSDTTSFSKQLKFDSNYLYKDTLIA